MNLEKFTERARGFLQAAQTIATREGHQRLTPEHLLKALMDDDQGLSANLIRRAGGAPERVAEAVTAAVAKLPKVSGDAGQVYIDPALARVIDESETLAKKAGDSFVPVERILMALAMVPGSERPGDMDGEFADVLASEGLPYEQALYYWLKKQLCAQKSFLPIITA